MPRNWPKCMSRLRAELLSYLHVNAVQQPTAGDVPQDSKGASWAAAGELVVRLAASPEVLISLIRGDPGRGPGGTASAA